MTREYTDMTREDVDTLASEIDSWFEGSEYHDLKRSFYFGNGRFIFRAEYPKEHADEIEAHIPNFLYNGFYDESTGTGSDGGSDILSALVVYHYKTNQPESIFAPEIEENDGVPDGS